jgi:hypothetical protein
VREIGGDAEHQVDGLFMEWDDARSDGFEPLRFLPPGKVVVLGAGIGMAAGPPPGRAAA